MFLFTSFDDVGCSCYSCSLNGVWVSGRCECDPPWAGASCSRLQELPVSLPQGYGQQRGQGTTWGASVISEPGPGGGEMEHHMFVSVMTNNCSLAHWETNSRVDHVTSATPTGPYTWRGVALNTWAHNSLVLRLGPASFALVHIGTASGGPDGGDICTNDLPPLGAWADQGAEGSTVHTARSLDGPWLPLTNNTLECYNPAAWVHTNGTLFFLCLAGANVFHLKSGPSIHGPWSNVTMLNVTELVITYGSIHCMKQLNVESGNPLVVLL